MATVDIDGAVQIATDLVRTAYAQNKLQQLTNRIVRQEIEKTLELETGTLDEKPFKKRLSEAVAATVENVKTQNEIKPEKGEEDGGQANVAKLSSSTKTYTSVDIEGGKTKKSKRKPSPKIQTEPAKEDERMNSTKPMSTEKPKKEKSSEKKKSPRKKEAKPSKADKQSKSKGEFISKDVVVSDGDDEMAREVLNASTASTSSAKKENRSTISESEGEAEGSSSPKRRRSSENASSRKKKAIEPTIAKSDDANALASDGSKNEAEVASESELSVLIDEPPIKKRKGVKMEKKSKGDTNEKKSRTKKESTGLSPDEEQIKKLKSLVVVCGVRKIWSKEFKDMETPSSQISHLRKMLIELGMKGRFSIEQAKTIKAKRDLAKEMEDVQEFAQRHAGDRPKRSTEKAGSVPVESSSADEEEETEPSRRTKNAHRSIMDFLGDQSESN